MLAAAETVAESSAAPAAPPSSLKAAAAADAKLRAQTYQVRWHWNVVTDEPTPVFSIDFQHLGGDAWRLATAGADNNVRVCVGGLLQDNGYDACLHHPPPPLDLEADARRQRGRQGGDERGLGRRSGPPPDGCQCGALLAQRQAAGLCWRR